jgi:hypothetical protein
MFLPDRNDINAVASPGGGVWSTPLPGVMSGNTFKPSAATNSTPFYVNYLYTDRNGCSGGDSVQLQVMQRPTIVREGDELISSAEPNYQWHDSSGPINGANSMVYIVTKNGSYVVSVNHPVGTLYSDTIVVTSLGLEETRSSIGHMSVMPNPATNSVTIDFGSKLDGTLCLLDVRGVCVYKESVKGQKTMLDVKSYPRGTYWLEFKAKNAPKTTLKLILD